VYVCSCFGITEQQVKQHADDGRGTPRQIASACKAGTDCGSCVKRIQALLGRGAGCAGASSAVAAVAAATAAVPAPVPVMLAQVLRDAAEAQDPRDARAAVGEVLWPRCGGRWPAG
jgi:bacterioferritin-associated ferredoxin